MRITFVSNYLSMHQYPFSEQMYKLLGNKYSFIETEPMKEERSNMNWPNIDAPYIYRTYESEDAKRKAMDVILESDAVIFGSAPYELIKRRIRANKLTFRYSERPLKKGLELWRYPDRFVRWNWQWPRNKNVYLLCASAYTASDFAKFGMFQNRAFKWGYFPQTYRYEDIGALIGKKTRNSIIWVARYLEWKHPEIAVEVAKRLRQDGYTFELNMIGNGQLMEKTVQAIRNAKLEDQVHILGAMKPEEVRAYMEKAQIHIFTSDRNEGWGAVLNESMNSACVPVANKQIGSVPYLIKNGENGFWYSTVEELYEKVKYLLDHPEKREEMANEAYATIRDEWNAEVAAERIIRLMVYFLTGEKDGKVSQLGVCSNVKG